MSSERVISLKIDIDTYRGLKDGVPVLIRLLRKHDVKGTFFISLGPDRSGRAIFNIFRRGFLKKMLRTNATKLYGVRTMLYGTLLPAPVMSRKLPEVMKSIADEGHEAGVHAWNHRLWQDKLDKLPEERIRDEFEKSFAAFREIFGFEPKSTAAPAWYCNKPSLHVQDSLGLDYCSDCRLGSPFYPRIGDAVFKTLQIPANQPCIEELVGLDSVTHDNLVEKQVSCLGDSVPNVISVHAEVEGGAYAAQFDELLRRTISMGYEYVLMRDIAHESENAPVRDLVYVNLPGRSGLVAAAAS
jgi:undecaprenyl phosphate-alpha-L-ara4FN deformylase